jgi:hypothetical protein
MPALTQLRTTVVRPKAANPSGPGLADLTVGGGNAISLSIVVAGSCSLVSLAHPSYLPIGEIDTGKRTNSRKRIAEPNPKKDAGFVVDFLSGCHPPKSVPLGEAEW